MGKHKLFRNAAVLCVNQFVKFGARGIYILVLAHHLGPEIFGLLSYGHHWYLLFLPFSVLGMQSVLARELGRSHQPDMNIIQSSLALRLLLIVVTTLGCGFAGVLQGQQQLELQLILIFCLALAARSLSLWGNTICVSLEMVGPVLWIEPPWRLLEVLVGLALVLSGRGIIELAWLHVLSYWFEASIYFFVLRSRIGPVKPVYSWQQMKYLLRLGVPSGIALFAQSWLYQGPVIMLRWLNGFSSELGNVSLLMQSLSMLSMVPFMVNRALLPRLSREDENQQKRRIAYLRFFVVYGTGISLAMVAAVTLFAPFVIEWVLGERYAFLIELIMLAIWGMVPLVWALSAQQLLLANGKFRANAVAMVSACAALSVVVLYGFPFLGASVVGTAYVIALFVWAGISWLAVYHSSPPLRGTNTKRS
jgi:O-antigen/teichoic acid export membrane protein